MALSENIRFYREKAGMYQSDLGRILGVSAQAVSKWEVGKSEPDQSSILKMCQIFECSTNELFGVEDTKKEPAEAGLDDGLRGRISRLSPQNREALSAYIDLLLISQASTAPSPDSPGKVP